MSNYPPDKTETKETEDIPTEENSTTLDVNNGLANELPNFTIVLKTKKWIFFNEKVYCNDYSPYWIVHGISGHTELNIRAFDVISDQVNIIPYNNILKIVHESGAIEQLDILNTNIEKEAEYIKNKQYEHTKSIELYNKEKEVDVA